MPKITDAGDFEFQILSLAAYQQRDIDRSCAMLLSQLYWCLLQVKNPKKRCDVLARIISDAWDEISPDPSVGWLISRISAAVALEKRLEPALRSSRTGLPNKAASPEAVLALKALSAIAQARSTAVHGDPEHAEMQALAAAVQAGHAVGQLIGHFAGLAGRRLSGRRADPEREVFREHFAAWKRGEVKHGKAKKKADFMRAMEEALSASASQLADWYKQALHDHKNGEI